MNRLFMMGLLVAAVVAGTAPQALAQDDPLPAKWLDIEAVCNDDGYVDFAVTLTMAAIIGTELEVRFIIPPYAEVEGYFIPQGELSVSATIPTGLTSVDAGTAIVQVRRLLPGGWERWRQPAWPNTWDALDCPPLVTTTTTEPPETTTTTEPPETTTTEPPETTTTQPDETTTTVPGETTTTQPDTTTTKAPVVTTTTTPPSGAGELPRTGSALSFLAIVGAMLVLAGGTAAKLASPGGLRRK